MPYILQEDLPKYRDVVLSTIDMCRQDRNVSTALYYGHFVYGLVRRVLGGGSGWFAPEASPFITRKPFQTEPLPALAKIEENLQALQELLSAETDEQMGELNYVLSAVAWGLLDEEAPYCLRAYVKGVLGTAVDELCKSASPYVNMLIRGLLTDVIDDLPSIPL